MPFRFSDTIDALAADWPGDAAAAMAVQQALRAQIRLEPLAEPPKIIAGVDVSYDLASNLTRAFIVLVDFPSLKMLASVRAELPTRFPYIPGFLSFREIPAILEALRLLPQKPDLLMVDGQGVAHPRRMGIAAHLGVLLDMPSIGIAKSRLVGSYAEPENEKGAFTPLYHKDERIGVVLRSKRNTRPLFISPGHRVDFDGALALAIQCLTTYRLPEPTRLADKLSKQKTTAMLL